MRALLIFRTALLIFFFAFLTTLHPLLLSARRPDPSGLGGGITYAWDPALCEHLMPKFDERNAYFFSFLSCTDLRAGMERAFASWEANHPFIRFHDMSELCTAPSYTQPCSAVELWITHAGNSSGMDIAATATSRYNWTRYFRRTNGMITEDLGVYATTRASISFNTGICWYLDSTFCSGFHSFKNSIGAEAALNVMRIIIFSIWTIAVLESLWCLGKWLLLQLNILRLEIVGLLDADGDDKIEWHEIVDFTKYVFCCGKRPQVDEDQIKKLQAKLLEESVAEEWHLWFDVSSALNPCRMALRLICLIVPLVFYSQVMLPCWDCFDFEAAATHEVGHVLGLHHPDYAAEIGRNMAVDRSTPYSCHDDSVWDRVYIEPTPPTPSIMNTFTQNPSTVCIEQDDLDGLNTLYPACSGLVTVPQCHKQQSYLGWVRLFIIVGGPTVVILILVLCCQMGISKKHEKNRKKLIADFGSGAPSADMEEQQFSRRSETRMATRGKRDAPFKAIKKKEATRRERSDLTRRREENQRLNAEINGSGNFSNLPPAQKPLKTDSRADQQRFAQCSTAYKMVSNATVSPFAGGGALQSGRVPPSPPGRPNLPPRQLEPLYTTRQ